MDLTLNRFLHGGDYNPDQWIRTPEIWDEDVRLMKLSSCNAMAVGIFSWSSLEPTEGVYTFEWLDTIMDKLWANGVSTLLATPSGARPAWMSQKYPEVLRVEGNRVRNLHGIRHNHCFTSPVYREKTQHINHLLAERYKDHPGLLMWHVSNEYGGACHCPLCQEAFREFLKHRYNNDLDALNHAWWTTFWSHQYSDWSEIESPAPHGENQVHGHNLDWKRFVTHQTIDFYKSEIEPLRQITPNVPITTNFMGTYDGLDYFKFAKEVDVVSWDNYPEWHSDKIKTWELASEIAFVHDLNRSLKGKPFLLMESTPSAVNWKEINKIKRPGMHLLSSLQAVAHGSDSVQYFQWRKSRGSSEKLHGAVVDHCGHEHTRVFKDVADVGEALIKLSEVAGSNTKADVAILYDWENKWALEGIQGLRNNRLEYGQTAVSFYRPFWKNGVSVDIIDSDCDFTGYKLLIAPMLYMVRTGVGERIQQFVEQGGTFVATYVTGWVNESDLCYLGRFPGPLSSVLGIWSEEVDTLDDSESNHISILSSNSEFTRLQNSYKAHTFCDLIHAKTAEVLATYEGGFYAGRPALTVNHFGKGRAYYIAPRLESAFQDDFMDLLIDGLMLDRALPNLPLGVTAQRRSKDGVDYTFVMSFSEDGQRITLPQPMHDLLSGNTYEGEVTLKPYGIMVLKV